MLPHYCAEGECGFCVRSTLFSEKSGETVVRFGVDEMLGSAGRRLGEEGTNP